MPRTLATIAFALVSTLLIAGCSGLQKAPRCKGTYQPLNAPEHYLPGKGRTS
jgi:outer membrane murein-binding lipoprotein Lpp